MQAHPFTGHTALMLGNEGAGLSPKQLSLCDGLLYIPQHGAGTASLNVTVAASIVLHHFAVWARLPETGREGAKFVVAERPVKTRGRGAPGAFGLFVIAWTVMMHLVAHGCPGLAAECYEPQAEICDSPNRTPRKRRRRAAERRGARRDTRGA